MRILRLRAYYKPEITASSHLSDDMDAAYMENGITCINITPMPTRGISSETRKEYSKRKYEVLNNGSVIVHRFRMFREGKNPVLRAIRYTLCFIIEYFKGIKIKNIDLVHCGSTPPIQGMLGCLVAKRLSRKAGKKIPFVYNLQDIFPDSLVNTGMTKKGSLLWKIGRKIEDFTYRNADKIIVISEGFKRNIMEKEVPEAKIEVIPNWVDTNDVHPIPRQLNPLVSELAIDSSKFIVLYAGNFGRAQGADIVLKAAERLIDEDKIQFVIFGGGSEFQDALQCVNQKKLKNVIIRSLLPTERVSEVYSLGDVAIITCKEGFGACSIPSKTWSIMACETPILASFDLNSELCKLINEVECGVCVTPSNVEELCKGIIMLSMSSEIKLYGKRGLDFLNENLNKNICISKYISCMMNCIK